MLVSIYMVSFPPHLLIERETVESVAGKSESSFELVIN
jgi:hypothetical protein